MFCQGKQLSIRCRRKHIMAPQTPSSFDKLRADAVQILFWQPWALNPNSGFLITRCIKPVFKMVRNQIEGINVQSSENTNLASVFVIWSKSMFLGCHTWRVNGFLLKHCIHTLFIKVGTAVSGIFSFDIKN